MLKQFYRYNCFQGTARIILAGALLVTQSAYAYDRNTHDKMTDVAYEIMRAVANYQNIGPNSPNLLIRLKRLEAEVPGMAQFFADIGKAVPKVQMLPSSLPNPLGDYCLSMQTALAAGFKPDWKIPGNGSLAAMAMRDVAFPVTVEFLETVGNCNIDAGWLPGGGGVFNTSNKGGLKADHTGNILGFWAQEPDQAIDDWHMYSPSGSALNTMKTLTEAGLAAGSTMAVSCACFFACITDPFACGTCLTKSSEVAFSVVSGVDSLPDFTDWTSNDLFTGLGHHIDMKQPSALGVAAFDDHHGFAADDPGPFHTPDTFETILAAASDVIGLRVKFDPSLGPKRYQIELPSPGDFDMNSVPRILNDWEAQSWPHTQFTPVDNLALFGWEEFEAFAGVGSFGAPGESKNPTFAAQFLGWPLHAIGDATVPMHVTNTSGWGHRPYEDAIDHMMVAQENSPPLLREDDESVQSDNIEEILKRALSLRKMITDWRVAHPALANEVPVRDLVTAVATGTFQKSMAKPNSIFDANASLAYFLSKDSATQAFENPQIRGIALDLLQDGIAAEVAFLTSAMEVM